MDKYLVMDIRSLRNKFNFAYKMKNQTLEVVKHHPYLGLALTDDMKYNQHVDSIYTSKASRILGFVKRNLRHCPTVVKERAYQTLVRPNLNIVLLFGILNK